MEIDTPTRLLSGLLEPNRADVSDQPALILDTRGDCSPDTLDQLHPWLLLQPLPVIGICDGIPPVAEGLDLIVATENECRSLLQKIETNPRASAVLVQVSRETRDLSLRSALTFESLGYATLQGGSEYQSWLASREPPRASIVAEPVHAYRDGRALHVRLDSPANRNALSVAMRDALSELFRMAVMDREIHRVIVSASGPDFCAGGDLREFGLAEDLAESHQVRQLRMPAQYIGMAPHKFQFHLHGACIGAGIEMPAFAEMLVATPDASFRLPEVGFGLIPGAGGCVSIPRRIGRHRFNALAISGRTLSADEALEWGLIDAIEPIGDKND